MNQEEYLKSIDQSLKVIAKELSKMNETQPKPTKEPKAYKGKPPDKKTQTK
ncbi:hypothetical protein [Alkalibacillus salilacus]|uniref:HemX protein n=1 Tax=Alkalibacillus salilacus TaxID=284582 RepID=A0ABT9VCZ2_9BACI|nr:hypothetical protein [Alkalibacillus salilacus]MDQ0158813.1 hypothetical protein [Alkalibacillus salilacus]